MYIRNLNLTCPHRIPFYPWALYILDYTLIVMHLSWWWKGLTEEPPPPPVFLPRLTLCVCLSLFRWSLWHFAKPTSGSLASDYPVIATTEIPVCLSVSLSIYLSVHLSVFRLILPVSLSLNYLCNPRQLRPLPPTPVIVLLLHVNKVWRQCAPPHLSKHSLISYGLLKWRYTQ